MKYQEKAHGNKKKNYQEKAYNDYEKEKYPEHDRSEKKDFVWMEQYPQEPIYVHMVKVTYAESENYPVDEKYLAECKYYAKFEVNYAEGMKEDIDKNYAV